MFQNIVRDRCNTFIRVIQLFKVYLMPLAVLNIIQSLRIDGDLDVQVNGAGDLDFDQIACDSFTVQVNGAADANLTSIDIPSNVTSIGDRAFSNCTRRCRSSKLISLGRTTVSRPALYCRFCPAPMR